MASLKSMRVILDGKKKQKHRKETIKSIKEIQPDEPKAKSKRSRIDKIKKKFDWNDYLRKEIKPRKLVDFNTAVKELPINARIAYVLNKTYVDKKSNEEKNVYCNSGFYKGSIEVTSRSICEGGQIAEKQMMVLVGKKLYYLSASDIKQFYVYIDQGNLIKDKVKQCKDNIKDVRGNSLPNLEGGSRLRSNSSSNDLLKRNKTSANSLLDNRSVSASDLLRRSDSKTKKSPSNIIKRTKANSLLH